MWCPTPSSFFHFSICLWFPAVSICIHESFYFVTYHQNNLHLWICAFIILQIFWPLYIQLLLQISSLFLLPLALQLSMHIVLALKFSQFLDFLFKYLTLPTFFFKFAFQLENFYLCILKLTDYCFDYMYLLMSSSNTLYICWGILISGIFFWLF